ncbi:uncharacterized protein LAJ45_09976 [Morchella importuna]|uniref:uncharacterized protein n=1 Tax=Morchella importuna TaxID=1174673 RepID=UPI001E8E8DDD|nr:uncharacterized protein LAJ45_09976 [Morchella importuna]KAH8146054.1 hypothetical protein LAJ45_09976 [Morchella importuna]
MKGYVFVSKCLNLAAQIEAFLASARHNEIMIEVSIRLRHAILSGDLLLTKRILKNHPNALYNPDHAGNTSLHLAAEKGHLTIVQHLVTESHHEDAGISKNAVSDTPLMLAAAGGHETVVIFLAGAFERCIDWRNKAGLTAMMHAAQKGWDEVVNTLIDLGADIDMTDALGNTALHFAFAYGHHKTISTLVDRGATTDKRNRQGFIPLDYSYNIQVEQYFEGVVTDKRYVAEREATRSRAATPIFGRSERTTTPQRQRASSGS